MSSFRWSLTGDMQERQHEDPITIKLGCYPVIGRLRRATVCDDCGFDFIEPGNRLTDWKHRTFADGSVAIDDPEHVHVMILGAERGNIRDLPAPAEHYAPPPVRLAFRNGTVA